MTVAKLAAEEEEEEEDSITVGVAAAGVWDGGVHVTGGGGGC